MKTRCLKLAFWTAFCAVFAVVCGPARGQSPPATNGVEIVVLQGAVEVLPANTTVWRPARVNQRLQPRDRLHTAANSRVALRWSDQSILTFGASTELEILPPDTTDDQMGLHLIRGLASFFHRDQPGRIHIITRGAVAGVEGTEFVLTVDEADHTTLSVIEGRVRFGNDRATLLLTNTEQAAVDPGRAPVRTAGFIANNLLQWCFYYPAVINPAELPFTADQTNALADSLAAYRAGDLLGALAKRPPGRPGSDADKLYYAALLLAVGEVSETEATLASLTNHSERTDRLAGALRQLIAAVKRQPAATAFEPKGASELLAGSYFEQSRAIRETSLRNALRLARQAAHLAPNLGFAWARVAELEFSFGRTEEALTALNQSLALAPRNAQALALKGYVLTAANNPRAARDWFDRAIAADAALGNAWLGRGLVRQRLGDPRGGRVDLLVAAALEPQRAELRSYLGKAYMVTGDDPHATNELAQAKRLDPNDPTAWLYSALLNQRRNQINQAIRDLETSQSLNDNRSVYRSQLLLDQDSAVRSANLARLYEDAGMTDTSLNEAGRAVSADYGNYSAHLFLAGSYEQMLSPVWSNSRYDTPETDEFWLANLLAPTSAGWLSATMAEQPYARLFDENRLGGLSDTTWLSRGAWTEHASGFYTSGRLAVACETMDLFDPGQRPNENFDQRSVDVIVKGQISPKDSLFGDVQLGRVNLGDDFEYYQPSAAPPGYRWNDTQAPNLFLGYHHEWSPGVQTLFLATRQTADEAVVEPNAEQYIGFYGGGAFTGAKPFGGNDLQIELNTVQYSTELQQIWEQENHTTILGARYDWGGAKYENFEWNGGGFATFLFPNAPVVASQNFRLDYHHYNLYAYHTWQIADPLSLTAGLSYAGLVQPADPLTPPFVDQETSKTQISPKAGLIWTPAAGTVFRAAFTRSLSDFFGAQNNQLEPTEVAGFNQAYPSLIPESVDGDSSGSRFDMYNVSLEQKFPTGTYLIASAQVLYSKRSDLQGDFVFNEDSPLNYSTYPQGLNQTLDYRERTVALRGDQLLGSEWTVGAKYSLSQANLVTSYPDLPATPALDESLGSVLQTVNLHANWNHPSGWFASLESDWYHQSNSGFAPAEPGDDFWQLNALAGRRFWRRKAEFSLGILNLTDQNYQLEPLNYYNEMARRRTLTARLLISF